MRHWVTMLNKDKFMSGLGLCKRAGKTVTGDKLLPFIQSKQVYLVVLASDASKRTQKQIKDKSLTAGIMVVDTLTSVEISYAMGLTHCVGVGIADPQLVKMLKQNI